MRGSAGVYPVVDYGVVMMVVYMLMQYGLSFDSCSTKSPWTDTYLLWVDHCIDSTYLHFSHNFAVKSFSLSCYACVLELPFDCASMVCRNSCALWHVISMTKAVLHAKLKVGAGLFSNFDWIRSSSIPQIYHTKLDPRISQNCSVKTTSSTR